ncbi:MAG: ABC transporter ATP-binding protein [Rhodospirillales bacterium]|nr:ABC transporter ATP-binding protein [Rhodospirillales bacterium]
MEIRLEKFSKSFGPVKVIEDMDLTIGDCEMIALLGPSGCGKTTTLYAVCGIHKVTSGRIWFGDKDVTALPPQKKNVGVVFQSFALYPHLTIYENIAFPLRIRKESNADIKKKVDEVAGVLHMETLLDRRPGQLSGGQQQRVALARALVRKPDVLLMDEPLANLDAGLRLEMRSEIRRIQRETGCTSILVTHDQVEAMSMCDRIALMNDGKIQQIGSPNDMYHRPENRFIAGFIGSPPISFADGKVEDGSFVTPGLRFELPDRIKKASVAAGQNITVGVRPEYLQPDFATPIEGEVTFIESQGREVLYDITLAGGQVFRSIQTGEQVCKFGDRIRWGIDVNSAFFFDEKGDRI